MNLVGVLGLLPLTGVPLPLLSYGGSFALTLAISLAIIQRISIENYNEAQKKVLNN
jgi:cell division protein FtsW